MYIELATGRYPVSEWEIKQLFPLTTFPVVFVPPEGYGTVAATLQPVFDLTTQTLAEGPPDTDEEGNWQQTWIVTDRSAEDIAATRAAMRAALVRQLDDAVIAVYDKPMKLAKEYEDRETAAKAYKDAGYSGTVPSLVSGFATPAGMTTTAATDLILAQAAQLRGALPMLANLRMRKYAILRAASDSAAQQEYDSVIAAVRSIAAQLG